MRPNYRRKLVQAQKRDAAVPSLARPLPPAVTPRPYTNECLRSVCESLRDIAGDLCGSSHLRIMDEVRRLEAMAR